MGIAQEGSTVRVHYTGKLTDGNVFDSSRGNSPLQFTVGGGEVIPGFDRGICGMALNETKTLNIAACDAYGDRREDLVFDYPRSELPEGFLPEEGQQLQLQNDQDVTFMVTVAGVTGEHIVLDANHPLAGQDLVFEVELVEILG